MRRLSRSKTPVAIARPRDMPSLHHESRIERSTGTAGQPRNIETSQPMSFKRSLHVSMYWLLQRQGSVMRTMMKPGSMMNLVRVMVRVRVRVKVRVGVRDKVRVGVGFRVKSWG